VAERRRGVWSWADIVRSMAVLVIPVLLVVGFITLKQRNDGGGRTGEAVPYARELAGARAAVTYPVLAPVGLPDGWRATSVRLSPAGDGKTQWHMGWLSREDRYFGLEQSDDDRSDLLADVLDGTREDGTSLVAGQPWDRLRESGGDVRDRVLVRTVDGVTTIVNGTGSYAELERFAATLSSEGAAA